MPDHDDILYHEFNQLVSHITQRARRKYNVQLEQYALAITVCPACGARSVARDQAWVTDQGWVDVLACRRCRNTWQEPPYPVFQIREAIEDAVRPLYLFVLAGARSGAPPERWRRILPMKSDLLRSYHAESIRFFLKRHEWVLTNEGFRTMHSWPLEYFAAWGCRRLDRPGLVGRVMRKLALRG